MEVNVFSQLIDYIIQQTIKASKMSKSHNTSYQGFRRKNSLNSLEAGNSCSSSDLTFLKFKHNEHLSEVQNISMQLENFSKRSLSSRSFCEENSKHSHSSTNIRQISEGVTQNRYFHSSRKQELMPQRKMQYLQAKNEKSLPKERKEKVSNSAIFNKFQVIQEDQFQNEQEEISQIQPVTFKVNPIIKPTEKKNTTKIAHLKPTIQPPAKKTVNSIKIQSVGVKKDKLKLELNELDKMQKELDSKRSIRENNARVPSSAHLPKKGKDSSTINLKDSSKMGKSTTPTIEAKHIGEISKSKQTKSSASILLTAKMTESKQDIIFDQEKKEECIPTRMLNEKEKYSLLHSIQNLRQIIDKNDICAQNLDEITTYFSKIEKLLTK